MEASQDLTRQVRLLTKSRNCWKNKAATKQGQILYLRVKVRDLEASRDTWKQRALAAESSPPTALLEPTAESSPPTALLEPAAATQAELASAILTQESVPGEC